MTFMEAGRFHLPPRLTNDRGIIRRAGFEFEYAGLTIEESARLVQSVFGGTHSVESTFVHRVDTDFGKFGIEIDTSLLKDKKYERPLRALGFDPDQHDLRWLEDALLGVMSTVVPIEIGTPPIPINQLVPLDDLRRRLFQARAKGTKASILYAFGMHINPEIPSLDPTVLRDYMRAFVLLYPWMKDRVDVDMTRSITPYIDKFPIEYCRLILAEDYAPDRDELIDDYLDHNPTRNRPLDMLPVLACLDQEYLLERVEDKHLVKARPAFHYRLPNCNIDDPDWSIAHEWNTWVAVERLVEDKEKLAQMSRDYLQADQESLRPFFDKWPEVLQSYIAPA